MNIRVPNLTFGANGRKNAFFYSQNYTLELIAALTNERQAPIYHFTSHSIHLTYMDTFGQPGHSKSR